MNYIDNSISKTKLKSFLLSLINDGTDPHAFEVHRDGKMLIRLGIPPYSTTDKRQIFSMSKTFSSTAAGLAYDRKILSLDEKLVDIFPEYVPENPCENLLKMTIHDVLTMGTGHACCTLPSIARSDDGIKAFFECAVPFPPNTKYAYNSGAGYIIGAIIKKRTGLSMLDFMYLHFFLPLGIIPQKWQTSGKNGVNEGGIGLFVCSEDIQKMGLLYLNKGIYNGKRILSEEWIKLASSYQISTEGNGTGDWSAGYGYQIWLNERDGYRADGAFGQFCTVIPKINASVTMLAESTNTNKYFIDMFDFVHDCFSDDNEEDFDFDEFIESLYKPFSYDEAISIPDALYVLDKNPIGFTLAHVHSDADKLCISLSDGEVIQTVVAGNGEWTENNIIAKNMKPVIMQLAVPDRTEHLRFVASYKKCDNTVSLAIRFLNAPHRGEWKIALGDEIKIDASYRTGELPDASCSITGHIAK